MNARDIQEVQAALAAAEGARAPSPPATPAAGATDPALDASPTAPAVLRLLGALMGDQGDIIVKDGQPALRIKRAELDTLAGYLEVLRDHRTMMLGMAALNVGVAHIDQQLAAQLATYGPQVAEQVAQARKDLAAFTSALVLLHDGGPACGVWAIAEMIAASLGVE